MLLRLALKILLGAINAKTAPVIAEHLIQVLKTAAAKTDTDIDDRLVKLLRHFFKECATNGHNEH